MKQFFVVDYQDDFVLYHGNLQNCEQVAQTNYGGLAIVGYRDLTPGMIQSLKTLKDAKNGHS